MARATQANLLTHGKDRLDWRVGEPLFYQGAQGLYDSGHARLVVAAQHCVSFGADHPVLQHRLHSRARNYCVQVGGQKDGLTGGGPRQGAVQIASVASGLGLGIIQIHLTADGLKVLCHAGGNSALMSALAVDAYIVQKGIQKTVPVDHIAGLLMIVRPF